jgi:hypothetical protein
MSMDTTVLVEEFLLEHPLELVDKLLVNFLSSSLASSRSAMVLSLRNLVIVTNTSFLYFRGIVPDFAMQTLVGILTIVDNVCSKMARITLFS